MGNEPYSISENDLLMTEMRKSIESEGLTKDDFKMLSELWPGFFKGQTRSEYALYRQMKRLQVRHSIKVKIISPPEISHAPKVRQERRKKKSVLQQKIDFVVCREIENCIRKITKSLTSMMKELEEENTFLKSEVKILRPYKDIVETQYKHTII